MEAPAAPPRAHQVSWLVAKSRASRLLATIGAIITTAGLFVPFAGRDWILYGYPPSHISDRWTMGTAALTSIARLLPRRLPLPLALGVTALYAVLALGGLGLIPLLWRQLSAKGMVWLRWTYATWWALLTVLVAVGVRAWWQTMSQPFANPSPQFTGGGTVAIPPHLLPGALVFPLGAFISGVAVVLMLREPLPATAPATAPRTGWQWAASLTLTLGMVVWLVGFYLMPEVTTAACPPVIFSVTQFAHGACAGLDSDQALAAAQVGLNPVTRTFYGLGRNFELLVALGGITTLGGWTRRLSASTLVWLAAWPVVALVVALVALNGVSVLARQGFMLTSETGGGWHTGPGMVVTFAGIGLVALGQAGLWWEMVKRKER